MKSRFRAGVAVLLAAALLPVHLARAETPTEPVRVADLRGESLSSDARYVADWAVRSRDHAGLPFVIIDKHESRVFVFGTQGQLLGATPALVGSARGDHSVPGIGSKPIASIKPDERTTPAGRFEAVMGRGPKGEDILWVDYDLALALHRVVTGAPRERRLERLQSKSPAERRITYGCINVPVHFYENVVRRTFQGTRGIVYILPESRPAQSLFGATQQVVSR